MAVTHAFRARLERAGGAGTWVTVDVPAAVTRAFATKARVPVNATVNGAPYASSLIPDGDGGHFLVVNAEVRKAAGATAGAEVDVTLTRDATPRTVDAPDELKVAWRDAPDAQAAWRKLAPSHKKEYASWIADAKREETRERRAVKAVGLLADGRRLKG